MAGVVTHGHAVLSYGVRLKGNLILWRGICNIGQSGSNSMGFGVFQKVINVERKFKIPFKRTEKTYTPNFDSPCN